MADHSDFKQNAFSLSWWNYVPTLGQRNGEISKHNVGSKSGWLVTINPANNIFFQAGNGALWPAYSASYGISAIGWYHIVIVHSLTVHKIYVNGYLRASVAGGSLAHNTHDVWFGRDANTNNYAKMQCDETNYLTRTLTDGGVSVGQLAGGEIAELWNGGAGIELTEDGIVIPRRRMEGY